MRPSVSASVMSKPRRRLTLDGRALLFVRVVFRLALGLVRDWSMSMELFLGSRSRDERDRSR